MRVLVTGGRNYNDAALVMRILCDLKPTVVIVGDATGADSLAWAWCSQFRVPCSRYFADWSTYGKSAGPIRNQRMLDEGKPDLVVAFPGGRGTEDMVRRAERAGIQVKRPEPAREKPAPGEGRRSGSEP